MTTNLDDMLIQPTAYNDRLGSSAERPSLLFRRLLETQQMEDPLSRMTAIWCGGQGTLHVWEPPAAIARAIFVAVPRWFEHERLQVHGALGSELGSPRYDTLYIDGRPVRCPSKGAFFVERRNPPQRLVVCCETTISEIRTIRVVAGEPDPAEIWIERLRAFAKQNNHLRGRCFGPVGELITPASSTSTDAGEAVKAVSLSDVVLTSRQQTLVQRHILGFAGKLKHLTAIGGRAQRGILLEGPPGCGKSLLLRALLSELKGLSVCLATPSQLSSGIIDQLQHLIEFTSPCVVMIEEIDIFGQDRSLGRHPEMAELMQMLDGLRTAPGAGVLWIATTNRIEQVEEALSNRPGRFDRRIEFGPLPQAQRRRLIELLARPMQVKVETLALLVERTRGMTGAQMREVLETVRLIHVERGLEGQSFGTTIVQDALEDCAFDGEVQFGFTTNIGSKQ